MRVVQILSDFIRWRWAPFIGLVSASLFYVLLIILLIPSQVGASETEEEADGAALEAPEAATSERGEGTPETDAQAGASGPVKHIERSSPLTPPPVAKRRGFSPPLERPDPNPPAPAVPVPPPPAPPAGVAQELPQAPPPPDPPPPDEQARIGASTAARAATLAATRAARLSGRGLRPRMAGDVVGQPVHDEPAEESDVEEDNDAPDTSNADQAEAPANDSGASDDEPAEADQSDDDSDE